VIDAPFGPIAKKVNERKTGPDAALTTQLQYHLVQSNPLSVAQEMHFYILIVCAPLIGLSGVSFLIGPGGEQERTQFSPPLPWTI
jgi:hypothetical protein